MSQLSNILMADVVGSQDLPGTQLQRALTRWLASVNESRKPLILSPLTSTLGDEFQGVVYNLKSGINLIMHLEEWRLRERLPFSLRYVLYQGWIDTRINPTIAYGMMGDGLSEARKILTDKRRDRPNIHFHIHQDPTRSHQLNLAARVLHTLLTSWNAPRDGGIIFDMISTADNEAVGRKHGKNRSQIWKRRQTLRIDDFHALRELIHDLGTLGMNGGELREIRRRVGLSLGAVSGKMGIPTNELSTIERTGDTPRDHDWQRRFDQAIGLETSFSLR